MPVPKRRRKGLVVSNFAHLYVVFKWHGSKGVKPLITSTKTRDCSMYCPPQAHPTSLLTLAFHQDSSLHSVHHDPVVLPCITYFTLKKNSLHTVHLNPWFSLHYLLSTKNPHYILSTSTPGSALITYFPPKTLITYCPPQHRSSFVTYFPPKLLITYCPPQPRSAFITYFPPKPLITYCPPQPHSIFIACFPPKSLITCCSP